MKGRKSDHDSEKIRLRREIKRKERERVKRYWAKERGRQYKRYIVF